MDINFPLILVLLVFGTGLIYLVDVLVLLPKRKLAVEQYRTTVTTEDHEVVAGLQKEPVGIETAKSVFPVLFIVLVLRSFLYEPFQIPSGSMKPTLDIGDFILVNKFAYGIRLPVIGTKVIDVGDPQRGDVMVFIKPGDDINFIKRVIGLPGDTIKYDDKKLYINGNLVEESFITKRTDVGTGPYKVFEETIDDNKHTIRKILGAASRKDGEGEWVVPEGHYFVMGDNRDNSNDSRFWKFVPDENIVGKAVAIWMHWPKWTQLPSFKNNGAIN
ncbi:signal peptidase I [Endozoicomonas sp. SM1973]|uniref:Signal peptidase I n=1 Tax=Spartinivicinus marinus TaxID=2994442 RepID=A0A853I6T7_9GAMM|nr:signal peptidase I [Spartinivicinus marinus]MCX4025494.1 signal peptidase I [Spartinivicinus marinus]NYZ65277.1 signal peptidase I [Spartinivicinus marinus]